MLVVYIHTNRIKNFFEVRHAILRAFAFASKSPCYFQLFLFRLRHHIDHDETKTRLILSNNVYNNNNNNNSLIYTLTIKQQSAIFRL